MRTVGITLQHLLLLSSRLLPSLLLLTVLLVLSFPSALGRPELASSGGIGTRRTSYTQPPAVDPSSSAAPTSCCPACAVGRSSFGRGCTPAYMHHPGVLTARLGSSSWRVSAARGLARRHIGLVCLQGVRSRVQGSGDRGRRKSSTADAKHVEDNGDGGGVRATTQHARGSLSGSPAATQAEVGVGKPRHPQRAARETEGVWRNALRDAYTYAESLEYLSSSPERALKGVGPKRGQQLAKLGINSVADLLWHLPTGITDRRHVKRVADLVEGEIATVMLQVVSVSSRLTGPTRVSCVDVDEDGIDIVMFGGPAWRRAAEFVVGEKKVVSGKVSPDKFTGKLMMASPDEIAPYGDLEKVRRVHPAYPLTAGLSLSQLRSVINLALDSLGEMRLPPEWIEEELVRERGWSGLREALVAVHNPQEADDLLHSAPARSRLAYDELLASQLVLALRRRQTRGSSVATVAEGERAQDSSGARIDEAPKRGGLVSEGRSRLPFELTENQDASLKEILSDMEGVRGAEGGLRMFRLLQGDVGSGKTAVAFLAMLKAAEQGTQSCMLAPTEVLTGQHLQTLRSMAEGIRRADRKGPLRVELLTGGVKGKARQKLLDEVGSGEVDILVATHAVLASASTAFRELGLAVVDEEQRFGVEQREKLTAFAQHVLYLSATPIPRSLTLALYGDMEVSQLREMPKGAGDIATTLIPVGKADDIVARLKTRQMANDKVFWVLPQINKSDSGARQHIASATERFEALVEQLGADRVSLLHGKMSSADKNKTLSEFSAADDEKGLRVLVSTSIIEVGVDVPRAGVCVVENAEMFGLSQLHQIRGRLGRTDHGRVHQGAARDEGKPKQNSHCILLYGEEISHDATERLKAVRATRDGFLLAERDLALRGPGEVLGVRQKGYLDGKFKIADVAVHGDLADHANAQARQLVDTWWTQRSALMYSDTAEVGASGAGSDRPGGFGPLLALCGRIVEAIGLVNDFAALESLEGHEKSEQKKATSGSSSSNSLTASTGQPQLNIGAGFVPEPEAEGGQAASSGRVDSSSSSSSAGVDHEQRASAAVQPSHAEEETGAVGPARAQHALSGLARAVDNASAQAMPLGSPLTAVPLPASNSAVTDAVTSPAAEFGSEDEGGSDCRGNDSNKRLLQSGISTFEDQADFLTRTASDHAEAMATDGAEDGGAAGERFASGFSFSTPAAGAGAGARTDSLDPVSLHAEQGMESTEWEGRSGDRHRRPEERRQAGGDGTHASRPVEAASRGGSAHSQRQSPQSANASPERSSVAEPLLPAELVHLDRTSKPLAEATVGEAAMEAGSLGSEARPAVDGGTAGSNGTAASGAGAGGIIRRADLIEGGHTVVLFDLETTGLHHRHDRIIQLAGKVMGSNDPQHTFTAFVDPEGAYMSTKVQGLTGITPQVLADNDARTFREVWPHFARWLARVRAPTGVASAGAGRGGGSGGVVLVAHNADFDHRFLVEELSRGGFDRFMMGEEMGVVSVVDSLSVLRQQSMWRQDGRDWNTPRRPDKFNLSVLFKHLYGVDMPGAHTALGDVNGLESVLSAPGITERWRTVASTTPSCQIPVPRSLAELQAVLQATPAPRARKPSTRGRSFSSKGRRGNSTRRF